MLRSPKLIVLPALIGAALLTSHYASAALLVYEGFNGYSVGSLGGVNPNANTVGLDTSAGYSNNGGSLVHFSVIADGLTFGDNFLVSGGAISTNTSTTLSAARLDLESNVSTGDTLWGSYLYRFSGSSGTSASDGAVVRVSDSNTTTNDRYQSFADSRSSSPTVTTAYGPATSSASGSGTLTAGNTYLLLSRFTNIGGAGNKAATTWALSLAQYESYYASGLGEAYFTGITVGAGADQVTGRGNHTVTGDFEGFNSNDFYNIVSQQKASIFDEIRYGTTLADVTPVPEPGVAVLLGLGLVSGGISRRLRRRMQR